MRMKPCGIGGCNDMLRREHAVAEYRTGKAVVVDIVPHAQHQHPVDRGNLVLVRHTFTRQGCNCITRPEIHHKQAALTGRCALCQLPFPINHKRGAIKHQLILSTHQVNVHHRDACLARPGTQQQFPVLALACMEGGSINVNQQARTDGGRLVDRARLPDILAHGDTNRYIPDSYHAGLVSRCEITLLIEDAIVGQVLLFIDCNAAILKHTRHIKQPALL